jgi:hypothetical protein
MPGRRRCDAGGLGRLATRRSRSIRVLVGWIDCRRSYQLILINKFNELRMKRAAKAAFDHARQSFHGPAALFYN